MARVLEYDASAQSISTTGMPPGTMLPHRTHEGDTVWLRDDGEGARSLVFGNLVVSDNSLTVLTRHAVAHDDDSDLETIVATLCRPRMIDVITAIVSQETTAHRADAHRQDYDRVAQQLRRTQQTHTNYKSVTKRKVEHLRSDVQAAEQSKRSTERERDEWERKTATLQKSLEQTTQALQNGTGAASAKQPVDGVYEELMRMLVADLEGHVANTVAGSEASSKKSKNKRRLPADLQVLFLDDNGMWCPITDERCVGHFLALHAYIAGIDPKNDFTCNSVYNAANVAKDIFSQMKSSTLSFTMGQYAYEASEIDVAHMPSDSIKNTLSNSQHIYMQHNTNTGKKRAIAVCPLLASSSSSSSQGDAVMLKKIEALADGECRVHPTDEMLTNLVDNVDFDAPPSTSTSDALQTLLQSLGNLFADYSGFPSFAIDKKKCTALLKPFHLRAALHTLHCWTRENEKGYMRLCAHASSETNLATIAADPVGLDLTYCRTQCRYGKANYVGLTYHAGEVNSFNQTGTPGKTMLAILISKHRNLGATPSPLLPYNFACTTRIKRNEEVQDAVAVFGNNYIIPLGIVSP